MKQENKTIGLSLSGYHSFQFFTRNLTKTIKWHIEKFGYQKLAQSTPRWEEKHGMRSIVLCGTGKVCWIFTEPVEAKSTAGKYLARHPDGFGFVNFSVKDLKQTVEFLAERQAPFLYEVETHTAKNGGTWRETAIAAPIDDVGFRFIEDKNYDEFAPGFEWINREALNAPSALGLDLGVDHITCNARSMHSVTEFYRQVMGFEQCWAIDFHTADYKPELGTGSGLESIVMWDKESNIKIPTNQPLSPYFNNSQIQIYIEENNGSGIQHIALGSKNIISTVEQLREKKVHFLEASGKYFEQLPARLEKSKIKKITEPMDIIQRNNILIDGANDKYLLQIFMQEQRAQFNDTNAGPFFYEFIQRAGDESFGEGNFKALFDSIEKQQIIDQKQEMRDRVDSLA